MMPVINHDEKIGKTVGRRRPPNPLHYDPAQKQRMKEWTDAFGAGRFPRGVYKFRSHEEADAWKTHHMIRSALMKAI